MFKYGRMEFISAADVSSDSDLEEVPDPPEVKPNVVSSSTNSSNEWTILSEEDRVKVMHFLTYSMYCIMLDFLSYSYSWVNVLISILRNIKISIQFRI